MRAIVHAYKTSGKGKSSTQVRTNFLFEVVLWMEKKEIIQIELVNKIWLYNQGKFCAALYRGFTVCTGW